MLSKSLINVAEIDYCSTVLGPGKRIVIWVQGCCFNCNSCINKNFIPMTEVSLYDPTVLFNLIIDKSQDIEGITITGGEPFLQPKSLAILTDLVKKYGLSIQVYSGFVLDDLLKSNNKDVYSLLDNIDVLIDGHYDKNKKIQYGLKGSSNQNTYFFTDRYDCSDYNKKNSFQVKYIEDKLRIIGFYAR